MFLCLENRIADPNAFIFTLKNPHNANPCRYMKVDKYGKSTMNNPNYGPIFGSHKWKSDICIGDHCNKPNSCWVDNQCYMCDPNYKCSIFVNSNFTFMKNSFSVLDYEVYRISFDSKNTVDTFCNYPYIMWEYLESGDISKESMDQFDDDTDLLKDLNTIFCNNNEVRLKLSKYYLKNPSTYLAETTLVNAKYDDTLKRWLGKYREWKLIYRASECGYSAEAFHSYCDDQGPTVIVIKSTDGWIFGGYTTQSWKGKGISVLLR